MTQKDAELRAEWLRAVAKRMPIGERARLLERVAEAIESRERGLELMRERDVDRRA